MQQQQRDDYIFLGRIEKANGGRAYFNNNYDDLYLDIIYCPNDNNFLTIVDEDELIESLDKGKITKGEFNLAKEECSKLFEEIKENKNVFVNMDKKELIQKYFRC